jgi:hypothetical protein
MAVGFHPLSFSLYPFKLSRVVLIPGGTSMFREFSKRRNEIYFLRFFSRVRSSFIDIVGSFLLSSINFQKVEDV